MVSADSVSGVLPKEMGVHLRADKLVRTQDGNKNPPGVFFPWEGPHL